MTSLGKEGSVIAKLESPRTLAAIPFSDLDTVVGPVAAPSARRVPAVEKSVEILGVSDGRAMARSRSGDWKGFFDSLVACGSCRATAAIKSDVELGHSNRERTVPWALRMQPLGTC